MVGFAVELDQLGTQHVADLAEGGLAVVQHGVVEDPTPVLGHEDQVGVEQRERVAGSSVVRLRLRQECRSSRIALVGVSIRQRLYPDTVQVSGLVEHCHHARFVFNIGLEQRAMWSRDRHIGAPTPSTGT